MEKLYKRVINLVVGWILIVCGIADYFSRSCRERHCCSQVSSSYFPTAHGCTGWLEHFAHASHDWLTFLNDHFA